jgi:hypothetical protein
LVNQVILNEETLIKEDSLQEQRIKSLEARILIYDMILEIDDLNQKDRADQVQNIKTIYDGCKQRESEYKTAVATLESNLKKSENKKKFWKHCTLAGIPLALGTGIILPFVIKP